MQIRHKLLGWEHPATANSLNNLGGLLMSQGKVDEAAETFRQSLDISRAVSACGLLKQRPLGELLSRNWRHAERCHARASLRGAAVGGGQGWGTWDAVV